MFKAKCLLKTCNKKCYMEFEPGAGLFPDYCSDKCKFKDDKILFFIHKGIKLFHVIAFALIIILLLSFFTGHLKFK